MKTKALLLILFLYSLNVQSQYSLTVNVDGREGDDRVVVILQRGVNEYHEVVLKESNEAIFQNLELGEWTLKLDAKGYHYSSASSIHIPEEESVGVTIERFSTDEFSYEWSDDSSDAGHAQQSFILNPLQIKFLNDTIEIPDNFSSLRMARTYGIILNDELEAWNEETAFKFLSNIERLPFPEKHWQESIQDEIKYVVSLSDQNINNDIEITSHGSITKVVVSKNAFTYAAPQIVTIEGIRGQFFSKRLYTAVLRMMSKNGADTGVINTVASERFGLVFHEPNDDLTTLMNEDKSNFQSFDNEEKLLILTMLEELPEGMHKQEGLRYLVRRINGQDHPLYPPASALAWSSRHCIEFMESAFKSKSIEFMQRLVLHEKSHFLWHYAFDEDIKEEWRVIGEWFEDDDSPSGWSTTSTTGFVSPYAHLKNPNEDMAESIAHYVQNPQALQAVSLEKFNFIRDRIMHGTRYAALIPDELTFEVYNIFPNYYYPGKVIGSKVEVIGAPEEDKVLKLELRLKSYNIQKDGASRAYVRFYNDQGVNIDVWLKPKNGSLDSVLVAEKTLSKHLKAGQWFLSQVKIYNSSNAVRLENASTIGMNLFLNNPLEDNVPPVYQSGSTHMTLVQDRFLYLSGYKSSSANFHNAMKIEIEYYDKLPLKNMFSRISFAQEDNAGYTPFSVDVQSVVTDQTYNSVKRGTVYFPIPEYYPSGTYHITYSAADDLASNRGQCYYVADTSNFDADNFFNFKDVRKEFEVQTPYPDLLAPVLDLNDIEISAVPTNPEAPNGETIVSLNFSIKDTSAHSGFESGIRYINYVFKDPQGGEHNFSSVSQMRDEYFNFDALIESPFEAGVWRDFELSAILPSGSAPGVWGLSSVQLIDRANNVKNYSFVEIVRFDLTDQNYVFTEQPKANINEENRVTEVNVLSSELNVSCAPCDSIPFYYYISSEFGGEIVSGEGIIYDDEETISGLDLSIYPDGVLHLRVEYTDAESNLIGVVTEEIQKSIISSVSEYAGDDILAYPNPVSDVLTLDLGRQLSGTYDILDESGRLLQRGTISHEAVKKIDMSNMKTGIYILKITTNTNQEKSLRLSKL